MGVKAAAAFAALALAAGAALAQVPAKAPRIAVVEFGAPPDGVFVRGYLAGMKELGYAEPGSLRVERRYAQGDTARLGEIMRELAAAKPELVFTVGNDIAQVAKATAPSLTVVTAGSDDPVRSRLIADYRRPGGRITGVTYLSTQLAAKRLELLREAVPQMRLVAVLWDPAHADTYYEEMVPAARAMGIDLKLFEVRRPEEIEAAFAAARKAGADVLFVVPSRMLNLQARRVGQLGLEVRLPVMSAYANFTEAGALVSYGAVVGEMLRRAAVQSDKILRGANAGELPFEQAATFELVLNLKTAKALGLSIPRAFLLRADRVIE